MKVVHTVALVCASFALAAAATAQDKAAGKSTQVAAKAVPAVVAALPTLPVAGPEQLLAASQAYMGAYDCEFKQTLNVTKHQVEGYVVVTFSSKAYTMKPVRSSTGAVRLEEVGNGPMLMVQIPTKSMLMDTVKGRRIVDACMHEEQVREARADTGGNALGMNLAGQVDTSCTKGKC